MWRKGEDQCGKLNHPFPHWEELGVLVLTNIRAMLFSSRKWWANWGVDGAMTPAQATSDHISKTKENKEGVVRGTEVTPLYFSGVGWRMELTIEKSPALGLKMVSPFCQKSKIGIYLIFPFPKFYLNFQMHVFQHYICMLEFF
jgi:hypothetical protein